MRIAAIAVLALLAAPAGAQIRHHNFTLGGGAAIPGGNLADYYSPTGFVRVGYGYRIAKNFQADTGIDVGFRAAGVKDFYESQFGPLRIRDYQYMVPFGGRVILPFGEEERVRFHAGGGGVYLRYSERSTQPFANAGIRLECPICNARSGWGYYGGTGGSLGLTPGGRFRFGGTVNVYRATTDGQGVGFLPAGPSRDRWVNAALELSLEF
jgi:hypothetical protein